MLNGIVTIICIALIAFILVWFSKSPENLDKRPSKNGLPRDSSGGSRGIYA